MLWEKGKFRTHANLVFFFLKERRLLLRLLFISIALSKTQTNKTHLCFPYIFIIIVVNLSRNMG